MSSLKNNEKKKRAGNYNYILKSIDWGGRGHDKRTKISKIEREVNNLNW